MTTSSIADEIKLKAKKFRIHPKFLLSAIAALARKPYATEADISQLYFNEIVEDFKKAEEAGQKTNKKGEPYHSNLTPIKGSFLEKYFTDEDLDKIKEFLPKNEPILHLHSIAYNHLQGNLYRIHRKWKEAGYKVNPPNEPDAVQIIKLLCPDLVEQYKELVGSFKQFDPSHN